MRVVVVGAGVGGLAAAVRLAAAGHDVAVYERGPAAGGKCGRLERDGHRFDTGPSLLTMPWVFEALFAETGAPLREEVELVRVEPVTRYVFADGTQFDHSADLPVALEALEAWSPGAGADWVRFLGTCASMWRASVPFLTGPPPWPPSLRGAPPGDPRDFLRVKPWLTVRGLARRAARDPRLRMVIERFATYAGADPRRAPAALAVAGYVEHAFGAWDVRGGLYELVAALVRRLEALGGELHLETPVHAVVVRGGKAVGIETDAGHVAADAVVWNGDAQALDALLHAHRSQTRRTAAERSRFGGRMRTAGAERSLSGYAIMLGLREPVDGVAHHTIVFPADYDAEFDDVFVERRFVREPTLYVSAPPPGDGWFVLVNAPATGAGVDEDYEDALLDRLARHGLDVRDRIAVRARRTPADLERETGAPGGAIYGRAAHGRLATVAGPGPRVRGVRGLYRVGGTVHPGGGLPLVTLGAATVARLIGS